MKYEQSLGVNVSDQERSFRSFISNDPALTYFLETGAMRKNAKFSKEEIYKDAAFLDFISPYFEEAYVNAVLRSFDLKDTNLMSDLAANPILLNPAYKQQAFDKLLRFLEDKKAKMVTLSNKLQLGEPIMILDIAEFTGVMTICLLNYLPNEFQDFRTEYCKEIVKLARTIVGRDFQAALNIMTDVRQLKCDAQAAYDADNFYKTLENANQKATAVASSGESNGATIWGVIAFIIFIIKMILIFAD